MDAQAGSNIWGSRAALYRRKWAQPGPRGPRRKRKGGGSAIRVDRVCAEARAWLASIKHHVESSIDPQHRYGDKRKARAPARPGKPGRKKADSWVAIIIHDIGSWIGVGAKVWRLPYDRVREHYDAIVDRDCQDAAACLPRKEVDTDCSTATPPTRSPRNRSPAVIVGQETQTKSKPRRVGTGRGHRGSGRPHDVTTINMGGRREALLNAMDSKSQVILIQEHHIVGPGLVGILAATMAKGSHGV